MFIKCQRHNISAERDSIVIEIIIFIQVGCQRFASCDSRRFPALAMVIRARRKRPRTQMPATGIISSSRSGTKSRLLKTPHTTLPLAAT
jgi:hypothetical protein